MMTKVENEQFYHIQRLNHGNIGQDRVDWKIGDKLYFGKDDNLLYKRIKSCIPLREIDPELEVSRVGWYLNSSNNIIQEEKNIDTFFLKSPIFSYFELIRETVLEKVRTRDFPNLPSRQKGIWLSDRNNLEKWKGILSENSAIKVFEVQFTGIVHMSDEAWIVNDSTLLETYYSNAIAYWEGRIKSHDSIIEFLGEGELEIIKEV